jgi:hypothetical protein
LADFGVYSDPSDFLNAQGQTRFRAPYSDRTPNDPFDEGVEGDGTLTELDIMQMEALGFSTTPVIVAKNPTIAAGESVPLSSIFSISGSGITRYQIWFSWAGGGYPALGTLTDNGTPVPLDQPLIFTSLSGLVYTYSGSAGPGTEKIWLQAYNGSWSNNGNWTEADITDGATLTLRPGPDEFADIWITNVFSSGGHWGVDDGYLKVGGWNDLYYSLLHFDLSQPGLPASAISATLRLYSIPFGDYLPTGMYVDEITSGSWSDSSGWYTYMATNPQTNTIATTSAPDTNQWIDIDVTAAVNDWLANPSGNLGIQLRPFGNNHNLDYFISSEATDELAQYRPQLVIKFADINNPPTVTPNNQTAGPGQQIPLTSIFSIGGTGITQYRIWFSWPGGGAPALGTLTNDGTAVPLDQPVTVTSLSGLVYTGSFTPGTDKMWLQAYNGSWSNDGGWVEADIADQGVAAPVVTANN